MQGKLTEINFEQKKLIKQLYNTGLNRTEVANRLGIPEWTVRKALKGLFRSNTEWSLFVVNKKEEILSHKQKQCILGTLLGDASLSARKNTWEYQVSHCLAQQEYSEHIANILNRKVRSYIKQKNSFSPDSTYFRVNYSNKATLHKISKLIFVNNKKTVNENWMNELDELGIAYWYMDDGTSSYYGSKSVKVSFSTLSFNMTELFLLQQKLDSFNIKTYISKHSKKTKSNEQLYTIDVRAKSVNHFMNLIEPHLLNCFKYKVKRK